MCPAMIEGFLLNEGLIGGEGLGVVWRTSLQMGKLG
jgi:hypothetical protein